VHVGAVTAGVIGMTKFAYDIWGDTVNVASRMESTGTPMQIQISEDMANCLPDKSMLTYRGEIAVKGKGMVKTYLINNPLPSVSKP
jgi:class 3 adenylate cyclase